MGYVGLCTAATLASRSFRTVGIDIDQERIQQSGRARRLFPEILEDRLFPIGLRAREDLPMVDEASFGAR